jgi:hypothetical protein
MAKRARYDGPSPVVYVDYLDDDNGPQQIAVERGHLLPAEVPAKVRDSLLEQDTWSSVDQSPAPKKDEGE